MQVSDAIRAIKDRLNLVDIARRYVDLKQNGGRFVAPCPFHQETKPSFSINPDKGFFYCFGCHAAGDIFEFYGKINGLDFKETLEQLAEEAGINIDYSRQGDGKQRDKEGKSKRAAMLRMHELATRHFTANLKTDAGAECIEYMERRGLSSDIAERFGIGWAKRDWHSLSRLLTSAGFSKELIVESGLAAHSAGGNFYDKFRGRLIFPIKNLSGQVIAFGGRIIADEDEAKYINSQDTPIYHKKEHLFGLTQARKEIAAKGFALLTEGYMDVVTLHQYGFCNGVGVLGTALTPEQIRRLSGFTSRLTLVFDGDRAGRKAALRSSEMLLSRGLSCNVALMPDGEDIDSLLRKRGTAGFEEILGQSRPGLDYCVDVLKELAPREAIEWAKNFLGKMEMPELASPYASILARRLNIAEDRLREGVTTLAGGQIGRPMPVFQKQRDMRDEQILIFAVRYPNRLNDLKSIGADLALVSDWARQLWNMLEQWGSEEVFHYLDETQKFFWQSQRGPASPPIGNGDYELSCLKRELERFYSSNQHASLSAALSEKSASENFETELEYLRAIQENMEKDNEQS